MGRKRFMGKYSSEAKSESPITTRRTGFFDSPGVLPGGRDIPGVGAAAGAKALFRGPWKAYPSAKGPLSLDSSTGVPGLKKKKPEAFQLALDDCASFQRRPCAGLPLASGPTSDTVL